MKLNYTFKRTVKEPRFIPKADRPEIPDGFLRKCNACKAPLFVEEVKQNHYICPHCGNYFRIHAYRRIEMTADEDSFQEWDKGMKSGNPIGFSGYEEKVEKLREKTGLDEAVVTGKAMLRGIPVVLCVCDSRFMMASMGRVVGEKITRAVERATAERLPVIIFACSGGARMQEGIVSLMQMAKTSAALKRHSDAGLLYISILTNPTTGGVTASFAMLGDIILAEPKALIGFAGPRVIEQTIGQKLPKGFQKSEFLLDHGFLDAIVKREDMRDTLEKLLKAHLTSESSAQNHLGDGKGESEKLPLWNSDRNTKDTDAWNHVLLSRDKERPTGKDFIRLLFDDFTELHGERCYRDDPAVIGGIAWIGGCAVTVLAQEKGEGTKESIARNFGMVSPEGYRKSLRLMKEAQKFHRPVICFVDTPGAFCGVEAEERGQGEAIAKNLYELFGLKVPVLSIVIGEGGSGGALAFGVADEVWMMENAVYSILSPEGFASILWKDSTRAKEAAQVMKLTAHDLKALGIVERVIGEKEPLTRRNLPILAEDLKEAVRDFIFRYAPLSSEKLLEKRYDRFRRM